MTDLKKESARIHEAGADFNMFVETKDKEGNAIEIGIVLATEEEKGKRNTDILKELGYDWKGPYSKENSILYVIPARSLRLL